MVDILNRVLRVGEGRRLRGLESFARRVNAFEPEVQSLDDVGIRARYRDMRDRVAAAIADGTSPEDALSREQEQCFALVREAARRSLHMRHFDVQLIGGIGAARGRHRRDEDRRGQDARRDAAALPERARRASASTSSRSTTTSPAATPTGWARSTRRSASAVGVIHADDAAATQRKAAYACDITYGTNSEFGFDYLRDNLATELAETVQRGHSFAIVDEVDSILIDEARTPLIISGQPEQAADDLLRRSRRASAKRPRRSGREDYEVDEKRKTAAPDRGRRRQGRAGARHREPLRARNGQLVNHLIQALKAESLYKRDVEYVVVDGEVKIVDEFTGRIMEGRRWSEGLHQAVEAKEGVPIEDENVTVATVTIQNYFRLYEKLAGMTGTALPRPTSSTRSTASRSCRSRPTCRRARRPERPDLQDQGREVRGRGRATSPSGTRPGSRCSSARSRSRSRSTSRKLLERQGIPHDVLNAKKHEREAEIIEDAGAARARSRSRPTWPAAASTSSSATACRSSAASTCSAPSATSRAASTTSCAAAPAARATPARRASSSRPRTSSSASSPATASTTILDKLGRPRASRSSTMLTKRIEGAQKRVEEYALRHPQERAQVRRRPSTSSARSSTPSAAASSRATTSRARSRSGSTRSSRASSMTHTECDFRRGLGPRGHVRRPATVFPVRVRPSELGPAVEIDREELLDRVARRRAPRLRRKEQALDEIEARRIMRQLERFFLLQVDRHALARAPRQRWTTCARASTCAAWPEGPARRVPHRGPRDVRGDDGRVREEVVRISSTSTSRCSRRPRERRGSRRHAGRARAAQRRSRPASSPPRRSHRGAAPGGSDHGDLVDPASTRAVEAAARLRCRSSNAIVTNGSAATTRARAASGKKYKRCHGA